MSPNLSSDSPHKDLKTESCAERNQNEVGKIRTRGESVTYRCAATIDILPDDILLEIFVFILSGRTRLVRDYPIWKWQTLAHVCRRWRQLILASPLRLDLRLLCSCKTSVRKVLGFWPAFPLVIDFDYFRDGLHYYDRDKLFAALKHCDRVRHINLSMPDSLLREFLATMEEPFPSLTHLWLSCEYMGTTPGVIPSDFLGGSTPRLHDISLSDIRLPSIPTFLSSASDLIKLRLHNIPPMSFLSPQAMVACLATLTKLETIFIGFQSPTSTPPDRIRLPPEIWVILPSVTSFSFKHDSAYLEDFVARINVPRLNSINITYPRDQDLRVTELSKFIERSNLRPSRFGHATIFFEDGKTTFFFYHETNPNEPVIAIAVETWEELYEQVAAMTMVLRQASALLSDVVHLEIELKTPREISEDDRMDTIRWLELFHPFVAVETLRVSFQFAESITRTFEEMPLEMITQVLPALRSLHWAPAS